jgi:hypothetical protein
MMPKTPIEWGIVCFCLFVAMALLWLLILETVRLCVDSSRQRQIHEANKPCWRCGARLDLRVRDED